MKIQIKIQAKIQIQTLTQIQSLVPDATANCHCTMHNVTALESVFGGLSQIQIKIQIQLQLQCKFICFFLAVDCSQQSLSCQAGSVCFGGLLFEEVAYT